MPDISTQSAAASSRFAPVGVAFLLSLVTTGWLVLALLLTPCFVVALLPLGSLQHTAIRIYRRVTRFGQWIWMGNVVVMLELMHGIQVRVTGDVATAQQQQRMQGERALWISNHRTCIDWLLLWSLAFRTHTLSNIRIVMKAPLRNVPIFGWAMQHLFFIFLRRHWDEDQKMLGELLPVLANKENGASYLLFPEGTDLSENNLKKSAAYAKKQDLPERHYTLYPRTTGWTFMVPKLRQSLDAIYDVTMCYVDYTPNERPTEMSPFNGRMPRMINFHVERTPIADIPEKEEELTAWVQARFAKKEAMLKTFYEENGKLPNGATQLFNGRPMATFTFLIALWTVVIIAVLIIALQFHRASFFASFVLILGYWYATKYTRGVDGVLLKLL